MLIAHPQGNYHFLQGIDPYSCGVVADAGYEIVHVTLQHPLPWRQGFGRVEAHLQELGRWRYALCGMELRSPTPFTMQGFIDFNKEYCVILQEWDLYVDGLNPVARTNVAPPHDPPQSPVLHGFSYTVPAQDVGPTLVVAGAGEVREGILEEDRILHNGDTSAAAMRDKAVYVMQVMEERLRGLGGEWGWINMVDIYTIHPMDELLEEVVLSRMEGARRHGVRWYYTRPPVVDIEFEMDMRGVRQELVI